MSLSSNQKTLSIVCLKCSSFARQLSPDVFFSPFRFIIISQAVVLLEPLYVHPYVNNLNQTCTAYVTDCDIHVLINKRQIN